MEGGEEGQRRFLTEEEYEKEADEQTRASLNELAGHQKDLKQTVFYNGSLEKLKRRSSLAEIVIRGLVLVLILVVASTVFESDRLPESVYKNLTTVLGDTLPDNISKVSFLFSSPPLWIVLCLADIALVMLFWWNESRLHLLRASPLLRSIYRGFLLPFMIVVLFVMTFGGFLFLNKMNDENNVDSNKDLIANGIARLTRVPIVGDIITSSTLVCVVLLSRDDIFCAIGAVFVFATVFACFLDIVQLLTTTISMRNLLFVVVLSIASLLYFTVGEFCGQFTFGFVLIITFHMIEFLNCVFDILSGSTSVRGAAVAGRSRFPDCLNENIVKQMAEEKAKKMTEEVTEEMVEKIASEMDGYMLALKNMAVSLRSCNRVVVYVGEEVVKDGGVSRSNLGMFRFPFMWKILPGCGMKSLKNRILKPLAENGKTESQKYAGRFVKNLNALNGAHITVVTECIDGKLVIPPPSTLVELRGNVNQLACSNAHVSEVSPSEQLQADNLVCEDCGEPLNPTIYLGSVVNSGALETAANAIDALQSVNGAIVVLGACENSFIRQRIVDKHKNDKVSLFQIGSSGFIADKDAVIPTSPRNVLFELVHELL